MCSNRVPSSALQNDAETPSALPGRVACSPASLHPFCSRNVQSDVEQKSSSTRCFGLGFDCNSGFSGSAEANSRSITASGSLAGIQSAESSVVHCRVNPSTVDGGASDWAAMSPVPKRISTDFHMILALPMAANRSS